MASTDARAPALRNLEKISEPSGATSRATDDDHEFFAKLKNKEPRSREEPGLCSFITLPEED